MVKTTGLNNYSDVHFTNEEIARNIVNYFQPEPLCLEPAMGNGVFFQYLPPGSEWCEISKGKDFFAYSKKVKWIVTNPPFSNLTEWMEHSFELADNVVFLLPLSKIFSSAPRLQLIRSYGGMKTILHLGTGRQIGFDIGFPFGAVHIVKGYIGPTTQEWMYG